jgi:hypothetical protein
MAGGGTAALLLALGASACGSHPASAHPAARPGSDAAARPTTGAVATSVSSPAAQAGTSGSASTTLSWLAMSNSTHGYGMFERAAGRRCEAESGVTADGGARFRHAAPITSWNCNDNPPVTKIAADAAGDAFAYGPKLFIAPSGSGRWRASPERGTVLAVSASGNLVWLLLARCHGAKITPDGCALHLVESANGGRHWRPMPTQPPAVTQGSSAGPAAAGGQTWLLHLGVYNGFVLASPVVNNTGNADSAALWYTGNGGLHWEKEVLPCGIDALSDAVSKVGTELAAVCAAEPTAGSQIKTTATSGDGGHSWTLHIGCLARPGCNDPLYHGYLGEIAAVSQYRIYLVGDRSSLLVTVDGGVRWHPVSLIGDTSGGTIQVMFFGRAHGLATGQGGATAEKVDIFRTSDGARSWSRFVPRLS